jgi:integrase
MRDGKQVQRTFKGTRAQARRALNADVAETPDVREAGVGERTFGDLLTDWLDQLAVHGRSPKTISENKGAVEYRIRPALGSLPLEELSEHHLDRVYATWLAEGLAPSSVLRHHRVISAALSQAVKWDLLPASPAKRATPPSGDTGRKISPPTVEQLEAMVGQAEEAGDFMMTAAITVGIFTGARRGELVALKWSHVDLDAGSVRIEGSVAQVGRTLYPQGAKTGHGRRLALDPVAVERIRLLHNRQVELAGMVGVPLVDDPFVVTDDPQGAEPVRPNRITERWNDLRTAAEVSGVRFNDIRHCSVTWQLAAGIDPVTVAGRHGHKQVTMTRSRYAHTVPAGDMAAASVIGSKFAVD